LFLQGTLGEDFVLQPAKGIQNILFFINILLEITFVLQTI